MTYNLQQGATYVIHKSMRTGRPTGDPKDILIAARVARRHVAHLDQLARRRGISRSEALRQVVEDWAGGLSKLTPVNIRPHQYTPEERNTVNELRRVMAPKKRES